MAEPAKASRRLPSLTEKRVEHIVERLAQGKRVRRNLPGGGRLHVDRLLPFLCLYRQPPDRDDPGTDRLCVGEAAYLLASGDRSQRAALRLLVRRLAELMVDRFGAFLLLEVWSAESGATSPKQSVPAPEFTVQRPPGNSMAKTLDALQEGLGGIKTGKRRAEVAMRVIRRPAPPGMRPLLTADELEAVGARTLGVQVQPAYVNAATGEVFPLLLRSLRRQISHVFDRTFYEFAHECTTHQPSHHHALGRRAMVKAVWDVDRRLAAVSNSFDFLFQVTPVNAEQAWQTFRRGRYDKAPTFRYRPRAIDPVQMKRALYAIPIERVEDPTLMHLFLGKQAELDRQLTLLHDLGRKSFLYGSLQLHGEVSPPLLAVARRVLDHTPARSAAEGRGGQLSATEFAARGRREVAWYRRRFPAFTAKVRVSDEMYAGLLVSRGRLLVGRDARIPARRADALIQHEVGTHLLTYYNGQAQPFKMLFSGLPGYDELQEGLAVLAEYLVDGLSRGRLRLLAARVVAAHALVRGADFIEVYRLLSRTHGFSRRAAYTIAMRIFRGGGLVKDAVYLRGLVGILDYLGKGGALEPLFIGKIAAEHIPIVEELVHRGILISPPVYPRYLESEPARRRLADLRQGADVLQLVSTPHRRKK